MGAEQIVILPFCSNRNRKMNCHLKTMMETITFDMVPSFGVKVWRWLLPSMPTTPSSNPEVWSSEGPVRSEVGSGGLNPSPGVEDESAGRLYESDFGSVLFCPDGIFTCSRLTGLLGLLGSSGTARPAAPWVSPTEHSVRFKTWRVIQLLTKDLIDEMIHLRMYRRVDLRTAKTNKSKVR